MSRNFRRILGGLLLFKVAYLALVLIAVVLWGEIDEPTYCRVNQRWPRGSPPIFESHFATWDAAHYLFLSEVGYRAARPSCAFYPMWPLVMRWSSNLSGGSHLVVGMIMANLFSLLAFAMLFQFTRLRFGETAADMTLACCLTFPGSLFFQFIYSESLFLMLALLLWWSLGKRRYGSAWAAAFLLPLTRAVGLFCVLPILYSVFKRAQEIRRLQDKPSSGSLSRAGATRRVDWVMSMGLLAAPLAGFTSYLVLMRAWTGNAFEGFHAQKFWAVHSIGNIWDLPKFVVAFLSPSTWHEFTGSVLDRATFVLLFLCLPGIWRLDKELFVWSWMLGVIPAMSGSFVSFTRFAALVFPMFIALGGFLSQARWRALRWGLLSIFAVLHGILLWRFVNFRWAG